MRFDSAVRYPSPEICRRARTPRANSWTTGAADSDVAEVAAKSAEVNKLAKSTPVSGSVVGLLPLLNAVRTLPGGYAEREAGVPLLNRFGLYQGDKLGAGWQPIAARRADNVEARFVASGAAVAVIDARGALQEGQEAARAVADAVEANAAALLVLLSRKDADALDIFHQHGATHFLVSPFTEPQLRHAIRVGPCQHGAGACIVIRIS